MSGEERLVHLDIGGKIFKTTVGTLTANHDSFFSQMFTNTWKEAHQETVFVDRDHECFPLILSYLRSRRLCVDEDTKDSYLKQALVESDFYGLMDLSDMITVELEQRLQRRAIENQRPIREVQKSISLEQLESHLSKGWTFVTQFKGNEVLACKKRRMGAQIIDSKCSACGDRVGKMLSFHLFLLTPVYTIPLTYLYQHHVITHVLKYQYHVITHVLNIVPTVTNPTTTSSNCRLHPTRLAFR